MSAYMIVEYTVKDPEIYREKYAPVAGQTAKQHRGEVIAAGKWEVLHGRWLAQFRGARAVFRP